VRVVWRKARMAAVAAMLAMAVEAARAATVLPDNGSVEFYDSTGEATFSISSVSASLDYALPPGDSYYSIQATFLLHDMNGNQITPPLDCVPGAGCFPQPTASVIGTTYTGYLGPQPDLPTIQYTGLPDGYYTVDIVSSTTSDNLLSPLTYTLTGDITAVTPIPSALPLFATGLGALGLLGWRRKRKNTATTLQPDLNI
jgi:hypothetical protein